MQSLGLFNLSLEVEARLYGEEERSEVSGLPSGAVELIKYLIISIMQWVDEYPNCNWLSCHQLFGDVNNFDAGRPNLF